ncbi:hypothetical protein B7P43_G03573 [Cryptotermes secundus]|uniref:Nucleoporin p58/p45 n=2 Tax=Cryptotermes secundus TaxID=105785 RepID=A0A2J7PCI7_9NEOP|nr:nucleoporin p58/p45 isoform X2 [Cryptotermes secundus]PNF14043.1 hypothetical protein B7P43_G03573 [Cryptotermes secundus]PNF14048.1 hypothetical protein B7P43_G03573 [Cryptotermes secundus]
MAHMGWLCHITTAPGFATSALGEEFFRTRTFPTASTLSSDLPFGDHATSQPSTELFGSPAGQTSGLSFGTTSTPTRLTFGTPTTTTAQTGISFGTSSTRLTFGTPATSASSTGLTFETPNVTITQTGMTFATPTTSSGISASPSFSTPSTSATVGFQGLQTALSTAATLGSLTLGTSTAVTSASGFSLLAPPTTSQGTGFALGGTTTSTSGGGLFGLGTTKPLLFSPATNTTTSIGFAGTSVPSTTMTSIGLGGIDVSQTKPGLAGVSPRQPDAKDVKENQIPNEILQTIETFKDFVKTQKGQNSDIARGSVKPLHKVQEDTESLKQMLAGLTSGLQRNGALADKLKADTAKYLHHAEMAQWTHETPPGLQYDNVAPIEYFTELVAGFEHNIQVFRQEIENTEKHIQSLSQPVVLTPQELALALKRLHDSFITLAGRLQTVHNSVETQKEQYLNLRKYFLKDSTNVFEESTKKSAGGVIKPNNGTNVSPGPTPFSVLDSQHGFGLLPTNTTETKSTFTLGNPLGK